MILKFELSLEEANLVMAGLGKLPFESVAILVKKLQDQATPQISEQEISVTKE